MPSSSYPPAGASCSGPFFVFSNEKDANEGKVDWESW